MFPQPLNLYLEYIPDEYPGWRWRVPSRRIQIGNDGMPSGLSCVRRYRSKNPHQPKQIICYSYILTSELPITKLLKSPTHNHVGIVGGTHKTFQDSILWSKYIRITKYKIYSLYHKLYENLLIFNLPLIYYNRLRNIKNLKTNNHQKLCVKV